ncbi:MAG: type IV secretion system protein [Pseudomonadota bacterium]
MIDLVDQVIVTYVLGAFTNLSPTVEALWRLMFIIFIALFGYRVLFSGHFSFNDLVVNTLKIVVILIFATQSGAFVLFFFDSFTNLPNEVAGRVLAGGASGSVAPLATNISTAEQALSLFFDRGMTAGNNVVEDAGWREFGLYFYAAFIWVVTILFAGYALMLIILSKLAVSILLAIGPLFLLLLMFQSSRGFFEGWFRALVNYAIIPVFVYSLLALVLTVMEGPLQLLETNSTSGDEIVTALGAFALVGIIGFVLMLQVTTMAAGVAGGFALSTMNFAGNAIRRIQNIGGGGRVGREAREVGYLRATSGLQRALTDARFGGSTNRARLSAGASETGSGVGGSGTTTPPLRAPTPSGASPGATGSSPPAGSPAPPAARS